MALRGHVLGSIADYEWAQARAEQLTRDRPADGAALIARARTRSIFHRFTDALEDLADARRLGADSATVDTERAAIFQAVGRYDDALTIMSEAEKRRADFSSVAAMASLYAESGDIDRAEHLFDESLDRYRGVSPIPLAQLHFQRAKMWLAQGDLRRARSWLDAAHRRLPAYAPAQGHLAEVEAALGETDSAIARLRPLTISSDDPDYPAQLARILTEVGRVEEARAVACPGGRALRRTRRAASRGLRRPRGRVLARRGCRPASGTIARAQKSRGPPDTPGAGTPLSCHTCG